MELETELLIEKFSKKGRGVASYQDDKVEVIGTVPGDRCTAKLSRRRKGWRIGFLKEIVERSPLRTLPRCAHVSECGGCSWQEIEYVSQLREKEEMVKRCFPETKADIFPIIACDDPWRYRNKMEFSFSQNRAGDRFLGLMQAGGKNRVVNLSECHLVSPWFAEVLIQVRNWWEESGLLAYRMNDEGALRTLIMREGKRTGEKLVMLTVSGRPEFALTQSQIDGFVSVVRSLVPDASIFLRIQQAVKGSPTQFFEILLHGPDHIKEILEVDTGAHKRSLTFKISPTSFFQPNPFQAEKLYSRALQMVDLPRGATVFDLYAGTATLGMSLSLQAARVLSIELNPHAVFDAQASAKINGIHNIVIHCGDVGVKLTELRSEPGFIPPDLAIVDPPRVGLDAQAIRHLLELKAKQILYISCNPDSQAENIKLLEEGGYELKALQPVDQFPHTPHIENIAVLNLRV